MPLEHIAFNTNTGHGGELNSRLSQFEDAWVAIQQLQGSMALMVNGDGSNASHFAYMQEKFGFVSNEAAKAAWDELNSAMAKLSGNGPVSDVNAALKQLFNKFRQ